LSVVFKPFRLLQADDLHAQLQAFVTNDSCGLFAFVFTGASLTMDRTSCCPFPQKKQMTSELVIASHLPHHEKSIDVTPHLHRSLL
jgi:hypothetical protein